MKHNRRSKISVVLELRLTSSQSQIAPCFSRFDAEWLGHAERGLPSRSSSGSGGRRIPIMGADDPPADQPQHTRIEEVVRLQAVTWMIRVSGQTHRLCCASACHTKGAVAVPL